MIVRKFGGSSLRGSDEMLQIADIIIKRKDNPMIIVLSAFSGVTDKLQTAIHNALHNEPGLTRSIIDLKEFHNSIVLAAISNEKTREDILKGIENIFQKLLRLLKGVSYTNEAIPRIKDEIMCFGERLSVRIMAGIIRDKGEPVGITESDEVSLIAHGEWGNGNADLKLIEEMLPADMNVKLRTANIQLVTGYFGRTDEGVPITFGRGGSDYVAALYAAALNAEKLEIWKDVDGFLSGSPEMVHDGRFLERLSYDEAAELAYFGAKILHPRTVEPFLQKRIPIEIRNTFQPDMSGTLIGMKGAVSTGVVKSVTFDRDVALLRVHGVDVGYTVGLLSKLVSSLSQNKINIRSVMTSQTCINILLDSNELESAHELLKELHPEGIDAIEPIVDIGLVAVIGEGLLESQDSLATIILDLYSSGIHVDLIVSGASKVASYFIVPAERLTESVRIVHKSLLSVQIK